MKAKIFVRLLFLIFFFSLLSCKEERNITENSNVLKIIELEEAGKIKESNHKKKFQQVFYPIIIDGFIKDGFAYRIKENSELWRVYSDKEFYILIGTIAKNDNDLFMFTMVYQKAVDSWKIIDLEIGNQKIGNYPKNIIPLTIK